MTELKRYLPHGCTGMDEGLSTTRMLPSSARIRIGALLTGCSCLLKIHNVSIERHARILVPRSSPKLKFVVLPTDRHTCELDWISSHATLVYSKVLLSFH